MKLGIVVKARRLDFAPELKKVLGWLQERGCALFVEETLAEDFLISDLEIVSPQQLPHLVDVLVVFGGDGTLLSVARTAKESETPILGVNLGSLGFLTHVPLDQLYPALERVLTGQYALHSRRMLRTQIRRGGETTAVYDALNDVVVNKGALARIISIKAYSDAQFIAQFMADGMIISTPTGSTAYSLSAGGPIVEPSQDLMIMAPICPHTLTNRPLILPSDCQIRLVLEDGEDVMLTVDGQVGIPLLEGDEVICTRSDHKVRLIGALEKSFYDVLREKLKWAER